MAEPTYRVTTILHKPYIMMESNGRNLRGYMVDLLAELADRAGFKYTVNLVKDSSYGAPSSRGEADIAAAPLVMTSKRMTAVDFTQPFLNGYKTFLIQKPELVSYEPLDTVFQPFSYEVWFCILFGLILVAILFMLIGRFNPYEWRQVPADKDPRGARHSFGLRESLMFVFSTMTLQGYRETPRSLSGRVLAVFWFVFIFLLVVTYVATVFSFILADSSSGYTQRLPFDDIQDIIRYKKVQVGVVRESSTFINMKNSNIKNYQMLAEYIEEENSFVKNYDEGIERLRMSDGNFAFFMDGYDARYIAEHDCSLMIHGGQHFTHGYGLAVKTGSPLRARLDEALTALQENNVLTMLRERWFQPGKCLEFDPPSPRSVQFVAKIKNFRELKSHFILLLVGAILSVLTLAGEIVFKKLRA